MTAPEEKYKNKILTIPNLLSLFRLLLIPVMVWTYAFRGNALWTTLLLALSGITDVVDGFIARRFHMVSDFGKAFDPVADKLTQIVMLICLLTRFPHMLVPLLVLVVKEVFDGVTGLLVIHKTGQVLGARWHGKAATVSLYAMMLVHILWPQIPTTVSDVLIAVCLGLILLSAVLYGIQNLGMLLRHRRKK